MLHKLALIDFLERKLGKSDFTEQDAEELSDKVKSTRMNELRSKGLI